MPKITDDWVIPELNRDIVIFKPEELERATEDVQAMLAGCSASHGHDEESETSEGTMADSVIELADATRLQPAQAATAGGPMHLDLLFRTANRLLQQPGMQQVVLDTMLNDPEIRGILAEQGDDMARFLAQGGIIPSGLLTDGGAGARPSEIQMEPLPAPRPRAYNPSTGLRELGTDDEEEGEEEEGPNFLQNLLAAAGQGIGQGIEAAGEQLSGLGRWIRAKIGGVLPAEAKDPDTGKPAGEGPFKGRRLDTMMGAVVTVAVAIVAVCVLRRPAALGGLLRRLFARGA